MSTMLELLRARNFEALSKIKPEDQAKELLPLFHRYSTNASDGEYEQSKEAKQYFASATKSQLLAFVEQYMSQIEKPDEYEHGPVASMSRLCVDQFQRHPEAVIALILKWPEFTLVGPNQYVYTHIEKMYHRLHESTDENNENIQLKSTIEAANSFYEWRKNILNQINENGDRNGMYSNNIIKWVNSFNGDRSSALNSLEVKMGNYKAPSIEEQAFMIAYQFKRELHIDFEEHLQGGTQTSKSDWSKKEKTKENPASKKYSEYAEFAKALSRCKAENISLLLNLNRDLILENDKGQEVLARLKTLMKSVAEANLPELFYALLKEKFSFEIATKNFDLIEKMLHENSLDFDMRKAFLDAMIEYLPQEEHSDDPFHEALYHFSVVMLGQSGGLGSKILHLAEDVQSEARATEEDLFKLNIGEMSKIAFDY